MKDNVLISVENLKKYYDGGRVKALDDVSMEFEKANPHFFVLLIFWKRQQTVMFFLRIRIFLIPKPMLMLSVRRWVWFFSSLIFSLI